MRDFVLPKAEDWQHRVGAAGYFVTKDGRLQMLIDEDGGFVICTMKERRGKGYVVLFGPKASSEELGIPEKLVKEGNTWMLDGLLESLKAAQKIEISLAGNLAPKRKR